jgi:hypothetical protein
VGKINLLCRHLHLITFFAYVGKQKGIWFLENLGLGADGICAVRPQKWSLALDLQSKS